MSYVTQLIETHYIFLEHNDFYHGRIFGELGSHVSLHMEDGIIMGSIHLQDEIYHIEVMMVA